MITNNISNNVKQLIKRKVLKCSNTNGLKQKILDILKKESLNRELNKYETLNLLNAIPRNKFFVEEKGNMVISYKYREYRIILELPDTNTYKIKCLGDKWFIKK